jgi:hypothetical protein
MNERSNTSGSKKAEFISALEPIWLIKSEYRLVQNTVFLYLVSEKSQRVNHRPISSSSYLWFFSFEIGDQIFRFQLHSHTYYRLLLIFTRYVLMEPPIMWHVMNRVRWHRSHMTFHATSQFDCCRTLPAVFFENFIHDRPTVNEIVHCSLWFPAIIYLLFPDVQSSLCNIADVSYWDSFTNTTIGKSQRRIRKLSNQQSEETSFHEILQAHKCDFNSLRIRRSRSWK